MKVIILTIFTLFVFLIATGNADKSYMNQPETYPAGVMREIRRIQREKKERER